MPSGASQPVAAAVIGGSAGAAEVVRGVLAALSAQPAVPVVIVLHVPAPAHDRLVTLLNHGPAAPVKQAEDKEPLLAGRIYVAPPAYHLLIEPTHGLALSLDEPVRYSRPAIDVLFESARDAYGEAPLACKRFTPSAASPWCRIHTTWKSLPCRAPLTLFTPPFTGSDAKLAARLPHC